MPPKLRSKAEEEKQDKEMLGAEEEDSSGRADRVNRFLSDDASLPDLDSTGGLPVPRSLL